MDPMSKAQGSLSPLRDAEMGVEVGRGERSRLWGPETLKGCRFPSLRNLGQPDTSHPLPEDITANQNQTGNIPA